MPPERPGAAIIQRFLSSRQVARLAVARIIFAQMFSYVLWRRAFGPAMSDLPEPEPYFNLVLDLLTQGLNQAGEYKQ